jgi:GNAT superfamily N-acetyltransferase
LFVGTGGAKYYARPRLGVGEPIDAAAVAALGARCQELGLATEIEWIAELTPSLEPAAAAAGLELHHHQLMVLTSAELRPPLAPDGFDIEVLGPTDPRVYTARATAGVGFRAGGTAVGPEGADEREAKERSMGDAARERLREQAAAGIAITAVATHPAHGVVASGVVQPVGPMAELVAVATLPAFRRHGLAAAVSGALAAHAQRTGIAHVLLSAESDAVARIYSSLGFARVGTHVAAEPAS